MIIKKTFIATRIVEIEIDSNQLQYGKYEDGVPDEQLLILAKKIAQSGRHLVYFDGLNALPSTDKEADIAQVKYKLTDAFASAGN